MFRILSVVLGVWSCLCVTVAASADRRLADAAQRRDTAAVAALLASHVDTNGRQPDGALRLPTWKTAGSVRRATAVDVRFRMHNGTLELPLNQPRVEGLDIDALLATGTQSRASIRSMRWRSGPYDTHDLRLTGEIAAGFSQRGLSSVLIPPSEVGERSKSPVA